MIRLFIKSEGTKEQEITNGMDWFYNAGYASFEEAESNGITFRIETDELKSIVKRDYGYMETNEFQKLFKPFFNKQEEEN